MKKALSIFLSIALLFSITAGLNLTAYAEIHSGICGSDLTWNLDTETGELVISGTGSMYKNVPWSDDEMLIKSVVVESGVTGLYDNIFGGCKNMTSLKIPDTISFLGSSGDYDTYYYRYHSQLLRYCTNLKNLYVDEANEYFSSDNNVLFDKNKKIILMYPSGSTDSSYVIHDTVSKIDQQAFNYAHNLKSISMSDNVTDINSGAFYYCDNLESIVLSKNLKCINDHTFCYCKKLSEILLPDSVTKIGSYAFLECASLTSITLPDSVTSIGTNAFSDCTSLTSVTMGNGIKSIGDSAFAWCSSLEDVYYAGTKADWYNISFCNYNYRLTEATIHCTDGVINEKPVSTVEPDDPEYPEESATNPDETAQKPAESTVQTPVAETPIIQPVSAVNTATATVKKPKATSIKKATAGKKQFKLAWKAVSGVTGYQIQYSTDKKFKKGNKTVTVKGAKKTSTTVKKLKSKKTYYVRIRTYKGKNYSSWSKVKTVKVK